MVWGDVVWYCMLWYAMVCYGMMKLYVMISWYGITGVYGMVYGIARLQYRLQYCTKQDPLSF